MEHSVMDASTPAPPQQPRLSVQHSSLGGQSHKSSPTGQSHHSSLGGQSHESNLGGQPHESNLGGQSHQKNCAIRNRRSTECESLSSSHVHQTCSTSLVPQDSSSDDDDDADFSVSSSSVGADMDALKAITLPPTALTGNDSDIQGSPEAITQITSLICDELEIAPGSKVPALNENLWGWGLNSLHATRMQQKLAALSNTEVDILSVMQNFTIGGLAAALTKSQLSHTPASPIQLGVEQTRPGGVVERHEQAQSTLPDGKIKAAKSDSAQTRLPSDVEQTGDVIRARPLRNSRLWTLWCGCIFVFLACTSGWAVAPIFAVDNAIGTQDKSVKSSFTGTILDLKPSDVIVHLATWKLLLLLPLYHLLFCSVVALLTVTAKWTIIGRYLDGSHALWGWYFCRCKFVESLLNFSGTCFVNWFPWTPMLCMWYRLLGTRVGSETWIGSLDLHGGFDLLEIGSSCYLEDGVEISAAGVCYDGLAVTCGPIVLADRVVVLERSVLLPGCLLPNDCFMGVRRVVSGESNPSTKEPLDRRAGKSIMCPFESTWFTGVMYGIGYLLLVVVFQLSIFFGIFALDEINIEMENFGRDALIFFPVFILSFMSSMLTISLLVKWCVLCRVKAEECAITPWTVWRFWFMHSLLSLNNRMVMPFWMWSIVCNLYVKLLGAEVDLLRSQLSDLSRITTQFDLLSIGPNTFVAGNVSLRCMAVDSERAVVEFANTSIGGGGYVGNSSVVCPSCTMADYTLVADFSVVATRTQLSQLTMVIGDGVVVSRGEASSDNALLKEMELALQVQPATWFVVARLLGSIYVLFLITASMIAGFECMFQMNSKVNNLDGLDIFDKHKFFGWQPAQFCFVWRPVVASIQLGVFGCSAFLHKWLFIGRIGVGPHHDPHAMDSAFFLCYWLCTLTYALFGSMLAPFSGTAFVSFVYTLMGANIGIDVKIFSALVLSDFDAFTFGEGAFIGEGVFMQCHSFLNGGLAYGPIEIDDGAIIVGCNSVFVSDTHLEAGSVVGPCSTVMRYATVPRNQNWQGNPATLTKT